LFWILQFFWPQPLHRSPTDLPANPKEVVSFWLDDAVPVVSDFTSILTAMLTLLGIFSLLRVHLGRLFKMQKDWAFSLVLAIAFVCQATFSLWDYYDRKANPQITAGHGWHIQNYMSDLLFDGMVQQFEAAMFSMIAFYILSAAYRAFRVRSPEASVLLGAALIVMLSYMGVVTQWDGFVKSMAGSNQFLLNFQLSVIRSWIKDFVQTPSIMGIEFGIGIGTISMGLRLWLSLEKTGNI